MATATLNAATGAPADTTAAASPQGAPGNANLPATVASANPAASTAVLSPMQTLQRVVNQPAVRKALPAIAVLFVLIVFGLYYAWMQSIPYRAVMPGLTEADQQAAYEALRNAAFKPQIDTTTGQLKVPADRYHEARMLLASQGLPKSGTTGVEGLKDQNSMTSSQFMEQVRYNAAMEQELARSILQIGSIQGARVHLATPKQSVFVRERTAPKASVIVSPHPGRVIAPQQVQAIVHLVSSSIPYLTPENVTVVDNLGKLMTESATEAKLGLTAAQTQHKHQLEETYRSRILELLSPIVGETNVRTQVNLALDFTQVETTAEDFDTRDKGPKTRSEVLSEERNAGPKSEGVPGALSNRPPEAAGAASAAASGADGGTSSVNTRSTRNFELDRSVRHIKNAVGKVERLSVAVVVNETAVSSASGASAAAGGASAAEGGVSPQDIERMLNLVKGVVGFNEARGDVVTVIPAKFGAPQPLETGTPWYQDSTIVGIIKSSLVAMGFIAFLLVVARPVINAMVKPPEEQIETVQPLADGELTPEDMRMIQIGEGETLEEIKAKLKPKKSSISMEMLDTANTYDDKVALIRMLVAEDSGRVALVLKNMIKTG